MTTENSNFQLMCYVTLHSKKGPTYTLVRINGFTPYLRRTLVLILLESVLVRLLLMTSEIIDIY